MTAVPIDLLFEKPNDKFELTANSGLPGWSEYIAEYLEELDAIEDPFVQMIYACFHLMPAINDYHEIRLDGLAEALEGTSGYAELLAEIQGIFNQFDDYDLDDPPQHLVEELSSKIGELLTYLNKDVYIDPDVRRQVIGSLENMQQKIHDLGGDAAFHLVAIWKTTHIEVDQDHPIELVEREKDMQGWLHDLNTSGTSLKSVSSVMQTQMEYEIGYYDVLIGTYKDMFKSFRKQTQVAIEKFNR